MALQHPLLAVLECCRMWQLWSNFKSTECDSVLSVLSEEELTQLPQAVTTSFIRGAGMLDRPLPNREKEETKKNLPLRWTNS